MLRKRATVDFRRAPQSYIAIVTLMHARLTCTLLLFALACVPGVAVAQAKNILYIGNSFTLNEDVPGLVARVASSAGKQWPTYTTSLQQATDFDYHIDRLSGPDYWKVQNRKYDFVVLQGLSTEPTRIGNPADYRQDAVKLAQMVRYGGSPNAVAVVEQTWAYHPNNREIYTSRIPNASAMTDDLINNAYAAQQDITRAGLPARVAPAGDVFRSLGFPTNLYQSYDWKHPSKRGGVVAALSLYATMYNDNVSDIPYNSTRWWTQPIGIDPYAWQELTRAVDRRQFGWSLSQTIVPEPAAMLAGIVCVIALRRRR
jgi:hypothetical protein